MIFLVSLVVGFIMLWAVSLLVSALAFEVSEKKETAQKIGALFAFSVAIAIVLSYVQYG